MKYMNENIKSGTRSILKSVINHDNSEKELNALLALTDTQKA